MSKFLEKLDAIASKLGLKAEKFEDVKDNQGNVIRIEDFVVGGKAQLISTDGSLIDLTDGEYTLEDGRCFQIANGVISTISNDVKSDPTTPAEKIQPVASAKTDKPAAPATQADAPADAPVDAPKAADNNSDVSSRLDAVEAAIEQIMEYISQMADGTKEMKSVKKQLEKDKEELSKKVAELEASPAGEPIQVKASKLENKKEVNKVTANSSSHQSAMWNDNVDYAEKMKNFMELTKINRKTK